MYAFISSSLPEVLLYQCLFKYFDVDAILRRFDGFSPRSCISYHICMKKPRKRLKMTWCVSGWILLPHICHFFAFCFRGSASLVYIIRFLHQTTTILYQSKIVRESAEHWEIPLSAPTWHSAVVVCFVQCVEFLPHFLCNLDFSVDSVKSLYKYEVVDKILRVLW